MNDVDFATEAASLLARCTPPQRKTLADMASKYGAPAEGAASDRARLGAPANLASDAGLAGKSIDQAFPGLKRLHGHADQNYETRFPDSNRLKG